MCHDAYAMGRILHSDLTTEKCFIVKQNGMFAHGKTLREARDALLEKLFDDMPVAERIEKFMESHDLHKRYPNLDFFSWHHRLTGSCMQGRTAFAQDHGIVLDGSMTTKEFLELTKDSYGGDIIRSTIKAYEAYGLTKTLIKVRDQADSYDAEMWEIRQNQYEISGGVIWKN